MRLTDSTLDGVLQLRFEGNDALDYTCAGSLKSDLLRHADADTDIVLDLSGLEFIDSAGLGLLISLFKAVRRRERRCLFTGIRPTVMHVIRIIRLDQILEIAPDAATALRSLTGEQGVNAGGASPRHP